MSRHLKHDMDDAYHRLLALSGQVEVMISTAVKSLVEREASLAENVIAEDESIDRIEVRIEEECLKMLALHQPVAADLRRLTTMMKINNDLEQIADYACSVASRARDLSQHSMFPVPDLFSAMAQETARMVREGLNAFVNFDLDLAFHVIKSDDQVDKLNGQVIDQLTELIQREPQWVEPAFYCFSAARSLEEIADHAANVAEDVVYMVDGVIVRHRHNVLQPEAPKS